MAPIHCTEYAEIVAADIDGVLSADERPDVEAHLSACGRCQRLRRLQEATKAIVRQRVAHQETPQQLHQAILTALDREVKRRTAKRVIRPSRWIVSGAIAAGLLLLLMPLFQSPKPDLLAMMARDVHAAAQRGIPLAVHTADVARLRSYYGRSRRIDFENTAEDFSSMGFTLLGGSVSEVGLSNTTLTVYEGAAGTLVCRRFRAGAIPVPAGGERVGNARMFAVDGVTVAVMRLGDITCSLGTTMPRAQFARYIEAANGHQHGH